MISIRMSVDRRGEGVSSACSVQSTEKAPGKTGEQQANTSRIPELLSTPVMARR